LSAYTYAGFRFEKPRNFRVFMVSALQRPIWFVVARGAAVAGALGCTTAFAAKPDAPEVVQVAPSPTVKPADMTMTDFLDRLMHAESSGRDDARNPLSTAVGPYQFIESTWLDLAHRIFATETQGMTAPQILALRTGRAFARRAAEAYTKDNAASLKAAGIEATFPHLRLAFLLGPQGAIRVLQAPPETRVALLLGPGVMRANPFMYGMTAAGLAARAARDLSVSRTTLAGIAAGDIPAVIPGAAAKPRAPRVVVRCNLELPACRRWQTLALARLPAEKSVGRKQTAAKAR
jgi:hypothetical protein